MKQKIFGGNDENRGLAIDIDPSDEIFLSGSFSGVTDFDPNIGVNSQFSNGSHDVFVLNISSSGNLKWVRTYGGSGWDGAAGIAVKTQGTSASIYTAGGYHNTVDFNPNSGIFNATSSGSFDIFVHKLYYDELPIGLSYIDLSSKVLLYPNPVKDQITVQTTFSFSTVEILDLNGKVVWSKITSDNTISFDSKIPSGVYFLKLSNNGYSIYNKINIIN